MIKLLRIGNDFVRRFGWFVERQYVTDCYEPQYNCFYVLEQDVGGMYSYPVMIFWILHILDV